MVAECIVPTSIEVASIWFHNKVKGGNYSPVQVRRRRWHGVLVGGNYSHVQFWRRKCHAVLVQCDLMSENNMYMDNSQVEQ